MNLCETIFRKKIIVNQYLRQLNNLREEIKTTDTNEKLGNIKTRYLEMQSYGGIKIANRIAEIKEITEAMKVLALDYQDSIATLEEFKVVERKENGEIFYKGDYDGRKEAGGEGKNFTDAEFTMPTLESIFARMTPEKIKLYAEMKEQGLEPKLQLTPIAKTIRSLAKHIDGYKGYPKKTVDTFVWDEITDEELIYEPEDYETNNDGKELITIGGNTKSKWIEENNGWIVDMVATIEELEADPEIQKNANNQEYANAEKTVRYHKKNKSRGYRGMNYESYAVAQMRALRNGKPLDRWRDSTINTLTDSSIQNTTLVAFGYWSSYHLSLVRSGAGGQDDSLRWRRTVRVY